MAAPGEGAVGWRTLLPVGARALPALGSLALGVALALAPARPAAAIERNFAGSAQLDYLLVPAEGSPPARNVFDGFTSEVALKVAVDVSDHLSVNVKVCHGCHGFELAMAYFDYRLADELNFRVGRFSPSFGSFNVRHDPANHATSSKPLPYDMGRMLRMDQWHLGVLPSPFPDNGAEINGLHWFGDRAQIDYAAYAVSGFKAPDGADDLNFEASLSRGPDFLVDNNGRPTVGGRVAFTFRLGEANDLTLGGSVMYGTYDPENRFTYTIAGADLAARLGRTQIRGEYLVRHQTYLTDPGVTYKLVVPDSGVEVFDKHGAYLEIERAMTDALTLIARADGLLRAGNLPASSLLSTRAAIFRYTLGGTFGVLRGWRIKASGELWAFSNDPPVHQDLEVAFHLGVVGTF
jgi:hypothetical protein